MNLTKIQKKKNKIQKRKGTKMLGRWGPKYCQNQHSTKTLAPSRKISPFDDS